jgi:hypothetical protein
MTQIFSSDEKAVLNAVKYLPAISLIMPFEPKISLKSDLEYRLKMAVGKVEKELMNNYPSEKALPAISRLRELTGKINYNTHKKSIAIFLSPMVEKVFYLDIPVEEKIIIDESFEIRDLVYQKKQDVQYLVLMLSGKRSIMLLVNGSEIKLVKSNAADRGAPDENDAPERVANFSDPERRVEILLDKFLHQMDDALNLMLNVYPLPVFVMGAERVLGHYKKLTKHEQDIAAFIHGNYEDLPGPEIFKIIQPYVSDWKQVKQGYHLHQLEKAIGAKKMAYGIEEVWEAATHKNCRLLLVERNFMYSARQGAEPGIIYKEELSTGYPFYIKDAVDDVIQKVLENGGDVEFVEDDMLKDYGRIALIQYY